MAGRLTQNPKVVLAIGAVVLVVSTVIAIFIASSYTPDSGYSPTPATTPTTVAPARP